MEKQNWFWLAVAAWLPILLTIFLASPIGAQTLPPAMSDAGWVIETVHRHQWKESEYGLHKKSESGITENRVFGTTTEWRSHYSWQIEHPVLLVDICETCGLLRIHKEISLAVGGSTSEPPIVGIYQVFNGGLFSDAALSRTCVLSVSSLGVKMGCLTPENKIHLHPSVKTVCNPARFRRNMRAAVKGSNKAYRYLEACAAKLSK